MSKYEYKPVLPKKIHRIAAFIIDAILCVILTTGILYILALIVKFDSHYQALTDEFKKIGWWVFNEDKKVYEVIKESAPNFNQVWEAYKANEIILNESFFVRRFSVNAPVIALSISLIIFEFILPLILKNGQTIGMKFFHVALISNNNLAVTPIQIFARCLIGKIAILGVIPALATIFIFLHQGGGLFGTLIVLIIYITQICLLLFSKNNVGIQDKIAQVYPVNINETIIYRSYKELNEAVDSYNKALNPKKVK